MIMEYKTLASPAATGGTITEIGGYRIHTFTSSGLFTVNKSMNVEYLVVSGGGGGLGSTGGGGGAGGMLEGTNYPVTPQTYTITVGMGGIGGYSPTNGENSVFDTITAIGGGSGLNGNGGSGGGGRYSLIPGGIGTPGQGNNGGDGKTGTGGSGSGHGYGAGGGGGKSAVGGNAIECKSGDGGAGKVSSITGIAVTYAGGGGGGADSYRTCPAGIGGVGGGGNGGYFSAGTAGAANTGGGGGGGANATSSTWVGGAGGSGIVVIRYLLTQDLTGSLRIVSTPSGAGIYLAPHGQTPSWQNTYTPDPIIGLIPGYYDIRLTRNGYEDWIFGNAEIIAGTETQISASMVLVSPANITATNMTITPSETPCRQGICTVSVSVTWTNTGGTSGSFVPNISVDGTPASPIYLSESLGPGSTTTHGFTVSGLSAGIRSICPYPN